MAKELVEFSQEEKKSILEWCREIIRSSLENKPEPEGPDLKGNGGVFVTLNKGGKLRGCIGVFDWSKPVKDTISRMAKAAAFSDHRFEPVTLPEVDELEIVVSVLSEPEKLDSIDDIVIGRDGLYLIHPRGRGVLLPVVAVEQGFTPHEFVLCTCRKAGLSYSAYLDPEAQLMVFRAPAFSTGDF
ncbi:MAG: AmmeMemoRadiSam system protein A [Deltaproteobacteria bacterium]|jgi:AmmeMemoRadiSam system protein A|nr:AmmeMemoRadiSam system protein A [Deltaproteobacteria bacterium]